MKKILFTALQFALLTPMLAQAATTEHKWSFETDQPGATDFSTYKGDWKTLADKDAVNGQKVYAQLADSPSSDFNLSLVDTSHVYNSDVSVKMKSISGFVDQGGGIVWRAQDEDNYYIARFNPLENNYRVYKVVNGYRQQLQSANIRNARGWHSLRVTMQGDHIRCYYDGDLYLDLHDGTFSEAGKIGLWTKADARTYFDDLTLKTVTY